MVSPNGSEQTWQFTAHGSDGAFVDALLAHVDRVACVDRKRIYAAGFSAGAAFTVFDACANPGRFAAIATVAAEFQLGCTRPLAIVTFHGTEDPAVPYENGAVGASLPGVHVAGHGADAADWAWLDRRRVGPVSVSLGSEITRRTWARCAAGTAVVLYRVEGGGRTWPGADPAKGGFGYTTHQLDADRAILAFFAAHPGR